MTKSKGQQAQTSLLPLSKLRTNTGQIPGLPRNPRLIRDHRFAALKRSISEYPDMLELREVVVFPWKGNFVCVGGNMRFMACKDLGYKEIPCKVLPSTYPIERLAEFAIKDNVGFGSDDIEILLKDWNHLPLTEWGAEIPDLGGVDLDDFFKPDDKKDDPTKVYPLVLNFPTEIQCEGVRAALLKKGDSPEAGILRLLRL
jgi:hypothetical protein